MAQNRKDPTCSHCLEIGHTKSSPRCPLKGKEPAERPEKEINPCHWNKDQEDKLKQLVIEQPILIDWEIISQIMNRSANTCESKYNSITTPEESIHINLNKLNSEVIHDIILNEAKYCGECNIIFFDHGSEWKEETLCQKCYLQHKDEINDMWRRIKKNNFCKICKKEEDNGINMHYDHINMFDKANSVCKLVQNGSSYETIIDEISKCQILCKSCHALVTRFERIIKFQRAKGAFTREKNKIGTDEETMSKEELDEINNKYIQLYNSTMEPIYKQLQELLPKIYKEGV